MYSLAQQRTFGILLISIFVMLGSNQAASARPAKVFISEFETNSTDELRKIKAAISDLLPARISVAKTIIVIDADGQSALQYREVQTAPLQKRCAFAKKTGADYLITGKITKLGDMISIDTKVLEVQSCSEPVPVFIQCTGLNGLMPEINKLAQLIQKTIGENPAFDFPAPAGSGSRDLTPEVIPAPGPAGRSFPNGPVSALQQGRPGAFFAAQPVLVDYIRSISLHCLATGDVNGDGSKEILAGGGNEIYVLRFDGRALARLEDIKAPTGGSIVHIDTADLNGHPPDEIYVSSFNTRSADSSVLEFNGNALGILQSGLPWFFRTLQLPRGTKQLIGQDAHLNNPFAGTIYSLGWDNGSLKAGQPYTIPAGLNVYGFTGTDISGGAYLAFSGAPFSSEYSLKIVNSDGKQLWRDTQSLGGTANFFKKTIFVNQTEMREPVPLRILYESAQTGGRPFMLVARNVKKGQKILKELINYNQGEVLCLVWNGSGFDVNWKSGYVNGYVADYIFDDVDGDGQPELCILSSTGDMGGDRAVNKISIYRRILSEN